MADESAVDLAAIIRGWGELPNGNTGITAANAIKEVRDNAASYDATGKVLSPSKYDSPREAFRDWARGGNALPSGRTVGRRLMAYRGRVVTA